MNLYVLVNLGILALPFALSFDRKVAFYRKWTAYLGSILIVSTIYIVWDILVTERGDWWFNKAYAGDPVLFGLPLGEVLFFVTVPYACLFIYEVVRAYFGERVAEPTALIRVGAVVVAAVLAGLAVVFRRQDYTLLALASSAALLVLAAVFDPRMLTSSHTWLFFLLSYVPFLVANGILTSLPIVEYNPHAIWGVRVYSIPLEDFFYNFGMLGAYLFVFRRMKSLLGRRGGGSS